MRKPLAGLLALALPMPARAGALAQPLSSVFNTEVYHQTVTGDGGRSFLRSGDFHKTNLDLFYNQALHRGPAIASQLNLQASDDPLLMGDGGRYKAVGGFLSVEKAQRYQLQAGYIVPKASRATLTATVLGAGGYWQANSERRITRLTLVAGQTRPPVEGVQFLRGVAGGALTSLTRGAWGKAKLSGNAYRIEDLQSSIEHRLGLARLAFYATSVGAELASRSGLSLGSELAFTTRDRSASTIDAEGRSLRVSPGFKSELVEASANFERNTPRFINPLASAAADVKKIDGTLSVGRVNQLTLNSLYTQDNAEGRLAATTKSQSSGAAMRLAPLADSAYWKTLFVDGDFTVSRTKTAPGALDSETRRMGVSVSFSEEALSSSARAEYAPVRDFVVSANDRDVFRASWQMGVKLTNNQGLNFDPRWTLALERSRNLATRLTDQGGRATGEFALAYADWLTFDFRHDYDQRVVKPSGRTVRNNATSGSLGFLVKLDVPVQIKLSALRKHYYDSQLNAFGEEELRGSLNIRF